MEQKQNKVLPLVALVLVAVLGVVGVTFAYFTSTDTFKNVFCTKQYNMEVVETFESPENWTPGSETKKTVVATNKGEVDAAVRVSYTEEWKDSTGGPLSLTDSTGKRAALINFTDGYQSYWQQSVESGTTYYYYKTKLAQNASTTSLIKSVTFNPDVAIQTTDDCVDDPVAHTKTCTTTASGYAGGTYTLTVKVETVQHDQYTAAWGTEVTIN